MIMVLSFVKYLHVDAVPPFSIFVGLFFRHWSNHSNMCSVYKPNTVGHPIGRVNGGLGIWYFLPLNVKTKYLSQWMICFVKI